MPNTLTPFMNKLLAQGLLALRQQAIMPRLVNRAYEAQAGQKGSTITVPIPSAIAARAVTPNVQWPANPDLTPTQVNIPLDQWWESPFYMTDKDIMEVEAGILPSQASEAIKALANTVDNYILTAYRQTYGFAGTPGTTPFGTSIAEYTDARTIANRQLAPMDDRRVVLGPEAEGNALKLGVFLQADQRGDQGGIINGQIGRKVGADWFMDQNMPTHVVNATGAGALSVNGVQAANAGTTDGGRTGTLSIAKGAGANWSAKAGDVIEFTVGGNVQQHVINADITVTQGANTVVSISPALRVATAGAEAITVRGTHKVNLLFHRDWYAFVSRPLLETQGINPGGSTIVSAADPVSGLTLRLEVARQYKQTQWSFDILFGGQVIRPEFAVRIAG